MPNSSISYKEKLLEVVEFLPPDKVREVIDYIEFLSRKKSNEEDFGFAQRFDQLREKTRAFIENRGFTKKDINRIIKEVRAYRCAL